MANPMLQWRSGARETAGASIGREATSKCRRNARSPQLLAAQLLDGPTTARCILPDFSAEWMTSVTCGSLLEARTEDMERETGFEPATSSLGKRHGPENIRLLSRIASFPSIQTPRQSETDHSLDANGDFLETETNEKIGPKQQTCAPPPLPA